MPSNPIVVPLDPCASIEISCQSSQPQQEQRVTVIRVVNHKSHSETIIFEGNGTGSGVLNTRKGKPTHVFEGGSDLQLMCKFETSDAATSNSFHKSRLSLEPQLQDSRNQKQYTIRTENDSAILYATVQLKCQRIKLQIRKGSNLVAKDRALSGKKTTSDPYIAFDWNGKLHKTKAIPKTLHPEWNEVFDLIWPLEQPFQDMTLELYDHDQFSKDDSMGTVIVPAGVLQEGGSPEPKTYPVQTSSQCTNATGTVELILQTWNTTVERDENEELHNVSSDQNKAAPNTEDNPVLSTNANNTTTDHTNNNPTDDPFAGVPSIFRPS